MNIPPDDWFEICVARLADPQNQRVWSIIVSLFGDLAQEPGDRLSGGTLTRIIGPMGVRPEAIRVALHRLRKDGWVESAREGRESRHFLTEFGRRQSAEVTPRIYMRQPDPPDEWHILIAQDGADARALEELLLMDGYTGVGPNVALGEGPAPADCGGFLAFEARAVNVPGWFRARIIPDDLKSACRSLLDDLAAADPFLPPEGHADPLQTATLRTLIVHRWRRVVLRHPDLPARFHPPDWPGAACREMVFRLLDRLPRPTPEMLEHAGQ